MTRAISKTDFLQNAEDLMEGPEKDTFVISKDGQPLGAYMPWDQYEAVRKVRGQSVIDAMMAFRQYMQTEASSEERTAMESALERASS